MEGLRCSTVVDGAINTEFFEAFVEKALVPQLRVGDVVVLDNLSSHQSSKSQTLIEAGGATRVFLPP